MRLRLGRPIFLQRMNLLKLLRKILVLLLACALLCASAQAEVTDADDAETNAAALRGLFIHTLGNRDFPSAAGLKTSQIKDQLADIVTTARMGSFNAIFFEARPAGDSFYNSRIFPKSRFLTGKQGAYALIDPLKLLVEKAKAQDIAVYAVVDPYYLGNSLDELHRSHPAAREPALTIEADGGLYLDPALAETDILNTDDIARMAKRYDLAGIIVEGVDRQSLKSQPDYSLHVLELMEGLSDALGDDPADPCLGIVLSGSADGSVLEDQLPNIAQAVDLIFPVISAPVGYQPNSFQDELAAWIRLSGVEKICPVSDAGRILSPETDGNWVRSSDEPLFALYTTGQAGIDNWALEGMNLLRTSRCELLEKLATAEAPTGSLAPDIDLSFPRSFSITRPAADLTTSYSSYYIMGTSDPGLPLLMDGEEISRGAQSGLFGKLVTLSMGKNQFTFSQDGESRTVTITRTSGGISAISTITAMSPASSTLVRQGNTLTFTCTAPSGSAVSISFLGRTVQLTQQAWASASAPATFKGTMKVSSDVSPSDQVSSLGPVSYTLVRAGKTTSYTSKGEVYYVGAQATPALEVTDHVASVLYDYTVNGVFKSNLRQGTTDAIAGEVGEYYELASGGYIAKATARVLTGLITVGQAASDIIPSSDDASENFLIPGTSGLTFAAEERENGIDLTLYNLTGLSRATLSESELFSSIRIREEEGHTVISFDTRSQKPVWGWDVMSSDQGTRIYFCRRPPCPAASDALWKACRWYWTPDTAVPIRALWGRREPAALRKRISI
jgi:hypothetical protein